jgi:secreted trypsin-like serine protease
VRRSTVLMAALAAVLVVAAIAPAQTGDAVIDGDSHPNVGAFLLPRADGSLRIICSGSLASPRVFLTAGHCAAAALDRGFSRTYVTFDTDFGLNADHSIITTPYPGTVINNPAYKPPYHSDTAIILLDEPVTDIDPVSIAPVGFLKGLRDARTIKDTVFTNVGYGTAEQIVVPKEGPSFPFDGIRKWTISGFYALDPDFIHLNQNLHQGFSGTGYGDSGGPTFVDTANGPVQISVVSTGDVPLYATSVNTRIDTAEVQDWLAPYLALN